MFAQDEDDFFNLSDFEFNLNLQTQIIDLQSIRQFSKQISYRKDYHHDSDNNMNNIYELCNDDWFLILDFIPFYEFCNFSLVCSSFAELLTFNRRCLVMRGILKEFPMLLKDNYYKTVESLESLAIDRSPSDDLTFYKSIYSDMINFLFEKKRYKKNMWKGLSDERILQMDHESFILPFRESMMWKTYEDFPDIPKVLLNDRNFILKFFKSFPKAPRYFRFLNETLKNDEEIAKFAVQCDGWYIRQINEPTSELFNIALRSRYRSPFVPMARKSLMPLVSKSCYPYLEQESILKDYKKSENKQSFFKTMFVLDSGCGNKNAEFILLLSFFDKAIHFNDVLLYFFNSKLPLTEKYHLFIDLITDLLCDADKFQSILSNPILVPKSLKCKTREITLSTILKKILDDTFTFNLVLDHEKMKLTKSSIEYLRERLIHKLKPTSAIAKTYFKNGFANIACENDSEKNQLLNEISNSRELIMKMLKYHPKYFSQISDEFKQYEEFKRIAMKSFKFNAKYFDFSQDDTLVLLLSSNVKASLDYLKKQPNWNSTLERIKNIFTENGIIRSKWLTWPQIYNLYIYLLSYSFKRDELFTLEDQVKMIDSIPPKYKKKLVEYCYEECLMEKIKLKNLISFDFYDVRMFLFGYRYMISFKSMDAICRVVDGSLIKFQQSDRLLSNILQVTPKFIKVFMEKRPRIYRNLRIPPYPVELIMELALENPKIIHYLPRNIQRKLKLENPSPMN